MKITNNTKSPLGIPGKNGLLEPGQSFEASTSQVVALRANAVIDAWFNRGMLSADGALPTADDAPAPPPAPEADEVDELIAALAEYGIQRDRRTTVNKLRALLEEAKAEAASEDEAE